MHEDVVDWLSCLRRTKNHPIPTRKAAKIFNSPVPTMTSPGPRTAQRRTRIRQRRVRVTRRRVCRPHPPPCGVRPLHHLLQQHISGQGSRRQWSPAARLPSGQRPPVRGPSAAAGRGRRSTTSGKREGAANGRAWQCGC